MGKREKGMAGIGGKSSTWGKRGRKHELRIFPAAYETQFVGPSSVPEARTSKDKEK